MKTALYTLLVVLIAALSAILGDMLMVLWLSTGVADVTGNIFFLGILPVELIAVGITSLLLVMAYKHRPGLYLPLYLVVSMAAHFFWLRFLSNPMPDVGAYLVGVLIACTVWFSILWRYVRRL